MGRDGTALLPSPRGTSLLRIYLSETEREIKIISTFSLFISNLSQKHCEKEHVCRALGLPSAGSASTCSGKINAAMAVPQAGRAGREGRRALTCSLGVPTGAGCNAQSLCRMSRVWRTSPSLCPFPESQVDTEKGEERCARRAGSKASSSPC